MAHTSPAPKHTSTHATPNPAISLAGRIELHGVVSLVLHCTAERPQGVIEHSTHIIEALRHVAAVARAKVDLARYRPQTKPLQYFSHCAAPVEIGVTVDVVALSDDDIIAHAAAIVARLSVEYGRESHEARG
ncbi:MAG: hypothetical protein ACRCV6_07755 [Formosimonas sp.]